MSADRKAFIERRRAGLGGSDIGAIVGVDPYRTALDVYHDKVDEPEDRPDSPILERGRRLEPIVRDMFQDRYQRKVKRARFRKHRDYPWMIGHPDGIITGLKPPGPGREASEGPGVAEFKTVTTGVMGKINRRGIPQHWLLQVQHYLTICDLEWGAFGILAPDLWQFLSMQVDADPEVQKQLIEIEEAFWTKHVEPGIPPEPVQPEWKIELPKPETDVVTRSDPEFAQVVERLRDSKELRKMAQMLEGEAKSAMKHILKEQYGCYEGGGGRVYFTQRAGRKSFEPKRLAGAKPLDGLKVLSALIELDYPEAAEALSEMKPEDLALQMDQFYKQGKPYDDLRMFHLDDEDGD